MWRHNSWPVVRIVGAILVSGFWLGAYAVWLAAHDPVDFVTERRAARQRLGEEQKRLESSLAETRQRSASLKAELVAQEDRARLADRAITALHAGDTWWRTVWDKLFGDAQQVRTKEDRLARIEALKAAAAAREAELRAALTGTTWECDGVEIALDRVNRALELVERDQSEAGHYLGQAWQRSRWYVIGALAAWLLGPAFWRHWRQSSQSRPTPGVPDS